MTNEDLNKLAELIVLKLIKRQSEYDAHFMRMITEIPEDHEIGFMPKPIKTDDDLRALHIDRMESLLKKYLEEERYEDAARVQREIDKFKNEG